MISSLYDDCKDIDVDSIAETKLPDTIKAALCIDISHPRILLRISKRSRATTNKSSAFTAYWSDLTYTCTNFGSSRGIAAGTFKSTSSTRLVVVIVLDKQCTDPYMILEYLSPPQKHSHQNRKRGSDISVETGAERPLKRARLTQRNLKVLENIGGQRRKSAGKKSTGRSSSITITTGEDLV